MCSFITQHNATDVASFVWACNWHADCRNVHQSCCPWIECSFLYHKPSPKAFQRICALVSIVLTPPILLPDYWLICPTCLSSLPSSFAPFIFSLCLQSCASSSSFHPGCILPSTALLSPRLIRSPLNPDTSISRIFTSKIVWHQPPGQLLQQSVCITKEFLHKLS